MLWSLAEPHAGSPPPSLPALALEYGMARVLALLPHPDSAERLRTALAADCARPRVACLSFAASWGDLVL